jgi:hypothetical protein
MERGEVADASWVARLLAAGIAFGIAAMSRLKKTRSAVTRPSA